jgi:AraC-like DNA-binding protein
MAEPTIAAGYPAALLRYAGERGVARELLLFRSGLCDATLADPDTRVRLSQYLALNAAATALCGDPAFALRFGEAVPMHDVSLVGLMSQFAESPEAGCALNNRYGRLALDEGDGASAARMSFVRERNDVWLTFASPLYTEFPALVESAFARCVFGIRAMYAASGKTSRWPYPKAVHFTHAEPGHRAEYDRIFDAPVVFGSDRNAWLMDEAFLAFRQPASDTYAAHALKAHADALLERLEVSQTTRGRVEQLLAPMLGRRVMVETVASELGLSRQTLLRRLKSEGTTFEQVADELRNKLALQYLTRQRLPVKRVANDLGYSDATAFARAFKRWTGSSPRTYVTQQSATNDPQ